MILKWVLTRINLYKLIKSDLKAIKIVIEENYYIKLNTKKSRNLKETIKRLNYLFFYNYGFIRYWVKNPYYSLSKIYKRTQ